MNIKYYLLIFAYTYVYFEIRTYTYIGTSHVLFINIYGLDKLPRAEFCTYRRAHIIDKSCKIGRLAHSRVVPTKTYYTGFTRINCVFVNTHTCYTTRCVEMLTLNIKEWNKLTTRQVYEFWMFLVVHNDGIMWWVLLQVRIMSCITS